MQLKIRRRQLNGINGVARPLWCVGKYYLENVKFVYLDTVY